MSNFTHAIVQQTETHVILQTGNYFVCRFFENSSGRDWYADNYILNNFITENYPNSKFTERYNNACKHSWNSPGISGYVGAKAGYANIDYENMYSDHNDTPPEVEYLKAVTISPPKVVLELFPTEDWDGIDWAEDDNLADYIFNAELSHMLVEHLAVIMKHFKQYDKETTTAPCAPNTQTFRETRSGSISLSINEQVRKYDYYGFDRNYLMLFTWGKNYPLERYSEMKRIVIEYFKAMRGTGMSGDTEYSISFDENHIDRRMIGITCSNFQFNGAHQQDLEKTIQNVIG